MGRLHFSLVFSGLCAVGSAQYIPQDYYGEECMKSIGFWENLGQIADTAGTPQAHVKFYSEGAFPRIYAREKSQVSFVIAQVDTDVVTVDTLIRLDMRPYGPGARDADPLGDAQKDWHQNFYLPHCGANGVEEVFGYDRLIYENVYDSIDMHLYSGSKGQKLAMVMRPGCDISEMKLAFEGQDSMVVDLWGNLKLFHDGKFFVIPFVQAYQIDTVGTILPVNWTADYVVDNDAAVVGFTWDTYDPQLPLIFQMGIPPFGPTVYDEPGLCWSTYVGGNQREMTRGSTLDKYDSYYITGFTSSEFATFPEAPGESYASIGEAAFLVKFDPLNQIRWKVFLGGGLNTATWGEDVAQRPEGMIYMVGFTTSTELQYFQLDQSFVLGPPAVASTGVAYVSRFNRTTGLLEWCTYFGTGESALRSVVGMSEDKLFLAGSTRSTLPALDETPPTGSTFWDYASDADGTIAMLNEEDRLVWATYLPGDGYDEVRDLAATNAKLAVVGATTSSDLQLPDGGPTAYDATAHGLSDLFLYEVSPTCQVDWGTCLGGPGFDNSGYQTLAIDPLTKDILVGGMTGGLDATLGGGWVQNTMSGATAFLMRFSHDDRSRTWSTYLHDGGSETQLRSVCFDDYGNAYAAGEVHNTEGVLLSAFGGYYYQPEFNLDNTDFFPESDLFVVRFSPQQVLEWGSYIGGNAGPYGESLASILRRPLGGDLLITGSTSRADGALVNYFPLDEGNGTPYFSDDWGGAEQDCFVVAFCDESAVGVLEQMASSTDGLIWAGMSGDSHRVLSNADRAGLLQVFSTDGRLIMEDRVSPDPAGVFLIDLSAYAPGTYIARAFGAAVKLVNP